MKWNPFSKNKEESNGQISMKEQLEYNKQSQHVSSSLGTSAYDESLLQNRRSFLAEITEWLQNCEPRYRDLFSYLSGVQLTNEGKPKLDEQGRPKISLGLRPKCNMNGAYQLIFQLRSIDHNIMNGNWDSGNIVRTMKLAIGRPLAEEISINHIDYGIQKKDMRSILWMLLRTVEGNYYRGWNDGERRLQKEITKVSELRAPPGQDTKKGLFGLNR